MFDAKTQLWGKATYCSWLYFWHSPEHLLFILWKKALLYVRRCITHTPCHSIAHWCTFQSTEDEASDNWWLNGATCMKGPVGPGFRGIMLSNCHKSNYLIENPHLLIHDFWFLVQNVRFFARSRNTSVGHDCDQEAPGVLASHRGMENIHWAWIIPSVELEKSPGECDFKDQYE